MDDVNCITNSTPFFSLGGWVFHLLLFFLGIVLMLFFVTILWLQILSLQFFFSLNFCWQLPRLYNVYKKMGIVNSFQNILDNMFVPLFEVTIDPNSHPQLHLFLTQVSQSESLCVDALFCFVLFCWEPL